VEPLTVPCDRMHFLWRPALVAAAATAAVASADTQSVPFKVAGTMQAVVCKNEITNGSYTSLNDWLTSVPVPQPKGSELLIRVVGSSVNPCDVDLVKSDEAIAASALKKTLGFDVSGVVVAVGPDTGGRLKVGDEVWTDLGEMGLAVEIVEMGTSR
jgi:NADPH:quinone reductase-like Zn-dependent oxidoreductase